nr:hypothetical protein [Gemmatimonadaceae bacterium]
MNRKFAVIARLVPLLVSLFAFATGSAGAQVNARDSAALSGQTSTADSAGIAAQT